MFLPPNCVLFVSSTTCGLRSTASTASVFASVARCVVDVLLFRFGSK